MSGVFNALAQLMRRARHLALRTDNWAYSEHLCACVLVCGVCVDMAMAMATDIADVRCGCYRWFCRHICGGGKSSSANGSAAELGVVAVRKHCEYQEFGSPSVCLSGSGFSAVACQWNVR